MLLPIDGRFQVILTTRQKNLSPNFRELPLKVLSEAASIELLRAIVDKNGSSRIEEEMETARSFRYFTSR